jgi:hypothetical protein
MLHRFLQELHGITFHKTTLLIHYYQFSVSEYLPTLLLYCNHFYVVHREIIKTHSLVGAEKSSKDLSFVPSLLSTVEAFTQTHSLTVGYTPLKSKMKYIQWSRKNFEGSSADRRYYPSICFMELGGGAIGLSSPEAKIRAEHLPNTALEHYN